ncbi:WxL domain-containing protein [Enterococcus faecium]|nr:WxL domain-containing protein [Enterococcus faecium]
MKKHVTLFSSILMMSTTLLGAGGVFADVSQPSNPTPNEVRTPITADLRINQTPEKPEPPTGPDQGGTDQGTEINGLFGIAYTPGNLSGQGELQEQGETRISLSNNTASNTDNKHNIGVQDKTRAKDRNWSLTAKLEWTNDTKGYLTGATIQATGGNVQINDSKGNLSPVIGGEVTIGDDAANPIISNVPLKLMGANKEKTVNGVYNYQFKAPELVIPNSQSVAEGSYEGNIIWNLSNVVE